VSRCLILCENIKKTFVVGQTEVHALSGVNLRIDKGEYVAIMGPSGSGKSTMMNILGCLDTPTSGNYVLDGEDVSSLDDDALADIRNRKVGFVFQVFNLIPRQSARRNVELPLVYAGIKAEKRHQLSQTALERVGLGHRINHKPNELSGGERQRVAIARALVNNPSLILADEPTGNLDTKTSIEIMDILQGLHDQGNTILLVTHEEDIAANARRIVRLRDGQIVSDESTSKIS
jgi:putative ABC transport system ATP-binding protein